MTGRKKISTEDQQEAEEQIRALSKEIRYDTKDYTIGYLVNQWKDAFFIPDYQRAYIWKQQNKSDFIESVLLGLPIPFMFCATDNDERHEVVDGAQRIQTLVSFAEGELVLSGLKKLTKLNGFSIDDLSPTNRRKFLNSSVRIVFLDADVPIEMRQELFTRINVKGIHASPSEVRRGAFPGPFTDFIEECTNNSKFMELTPMSTQKADRRERFELVLRYFAYIDGYLGAGRKVSSYLDSFLEEHRTEFDKDRYEREFSQMLDYVQKLFPSGFSNGKKQTPRVRFEALAVGTTLALRERPDLDITDTTWINGDEFKELTTSDASNNSGRLKSRIEYVRDCLLGRVK